MRTPLPFRLTLNLILLCGTTLSAFGAQVPPERAKDLARTFIAAQDPAFASVRADQVGLLLEVGDPALGGQQAMVHYRVYDVAGAGFVIVSGDDLVLPVLGYSTQGTFPLVDIPINVAKWLDGYRSEIRGVLEAGGEQGATVQAEWTRWEQAAPAEGGGSRAVGPLMQTNWNQSPHYNAQCPGGSVTGCVATAMAQIMKFHNHPAQGAGFHSYNAPNYGTLSANFGATSYNWGGMPNNVNSANSAVATLMYHCGVSVDMQYSPQVSGAWVIAAHSPTTDHNSEYALKTYFNYHEGMQGVKRENYNDGQWINLLKADLDASRPILYAGWGSGGGHAFVCDGYDNNNFFHFNWGWGGAYNGNFTINALNPDGVGTGGGTGGYNSGQQALLGIRPATGGGGGGGGQQTYDMDLYTWVTPSAGTIYYGQGFSVSTNIVNNGNNNFTGDYCAAVFDANSNFYGYVQTLSGYTLQAGFVYNNNLVFSTNGLFSMLPGTYHIGIFYRPTGGEWVLVNNNGNYTNLPTINVVNPNDIEINATMSVSPGTTVAQGAQLSVNTNIVNDGFNTFFGQYGAGLYNLDGTWAQDIGLLNENNGLPSGYTYNPPYLTFGPVPVTVAPGTYLLAVQHNPGNGWQLTGSSYHDNPIYVTVVAPTLSPDQYENNNAVGQAHTLPLNFSGNTANNATNGSNLHNPTDQDFYQMVLPGGFNYTVTARLHDSYNSGNGNTYTVDGLFSYSLDGNSWSSVYDDVMPNTITVNGGGTLRFHVAPYFTGETGTYLLQLTVVRSGSVGVEEADGIGTIALYPNPANGLLTIDLSEAAVPVERVVVSDPGGREVLQIQVPMPVGQRHPLDLSGLSDGAYVVRMHTSAGIRNERIILAR